MKLPNEIIAFVTPELTQLEGQKNEDLKKIKKYFFILISAFTISIIVFNLLPIPAYYSYFSYVVLALIVYALFKVYKLLVHIKEYYKETFKDIVMPAILEGFEMDIEYRKDYRIPEEEFRKCQIFPYETAEYYGEDYISGKIGKTTFELSDLTVSKKVGDKKNTVLFNGWFMIADFNKNFKGKTFIVPEVAGMQSGFLAKTLMKFSPEEYHLAKLEDPEFESRFAVYTNDQIEARYILSPDLMAHITELSATYTRDIHLSFIDSKIYIGITSYQNLFDPPFWNPTSISSTVKLFISQLMNCINIIDILNLNTRIWTKE
jgi:hypothetical protein